MKRVLIACGLLGVGLAGFGLVRQARDDRPAPAPDLTAKVAELEATLARQQQWMSSLGRAATSASAPVASAEAAAPGAPAAAMSPREVHARRDERRRAARARLIESMATRFAQERTDAAVTADVRGAIETKLATVLPGVTTRSVECGTTMCRVVVTSTDVDALKSLGEVLPDHEPFNTEVVYAHELERALPEVTMFVARPGHELVNNTGG